MIKSFSFIVLAHFFRFNQLKILRQPGYLIFLNKPTIFFTVYLKAQYIFLILKLKIASLSILAKRIDLLNVDLFWLLDTRIKD